MPDNRYARIIGHIFQNRYATGDAEVLFDRQEIADVAQQLGIPRPKNLGDVIYSFRFRTKLPEEIRATAPAGREWVIRKCGLSAYRFVLVAEWSVVPSVNLVTIKIPDATPGILEKYALSDEQALLAKLRYNRLIDVFTGSPPIPFRVTCAGV